MSDRVGLGVGRGKLVASGRPRGILAGVYTQTATHTTLLARLSQGSDGAAWAEFHERYGELIRRFARSRSMQASDCDDILQEVLLSLSKAMPTFRYDPTRGKFRSYLKTMVIHAIAKRMRQKSASTSLGSIEETTRNLGQDPKVENEWEAEWRQHHVRTALKVIESEFRPADVEAFRRYALQDHDPDTIAKDLGLSVDSVYQAKSRILKRLGTVIKEQIAEEG